MSDQTLSEEKLNHYKEYGLTDEEVELIRTPLAHLNPQQLAIAIRGKDKLHG